MAIMRAPYRWCTLTRLLAALALCAPAAAAKSFKQYTSCATCVEAGWGWSYNKQRCGAFANRECADEAPASVEVPPAAVPAEKVTTEKAPDKPAERTVKEYYGKLPVTGDVERIEWDHSDPDFRHTLAQRGIPLVISNSPALTEWGAFRKWTPQYLSKTIDKPLVFAQNTNQNFLFYSNRGQDKYNSSVGVWRAPSQSVRKTVKQFLRFAKTAASSSEPTDTHLYYYKNVGPNTPFKPVLGDISPYSWFTIDHDHMNRLKAGKRSKAKPTQATAVMWFGMAGVRSTIHYDESYNFYVQIFGNKKWYFSHPKNYDSCYIYPMAHPSSRQCQLDWPHVDTSRFDRPTKTTGFPGKMELISTTLKAGEVLYIPPTWFHATEALDVNLALNYWSQGVNAQQTWMDMSLTCHAETKTSNIPANTLAMQLWLTLLHSVEKTLHITEKRGNRLDPGPKLASAMLRYTERYTKDNSDGVKPSKRPAKWLKVKMGKGWKKKRLPCLTNGDKMLAKELTKLGIETGYESTSARVLLGDYMEGLARGVMSSVGVGQFMNEMTTHLRKLGASPLL